MKRSRMLAIVVLTIGLSGGACAVSQETAVEPPQVRSIVDGNNAFAFDLYGRLSGREGNLFLSPFSVSSALAMTYAGARGPTAEEMARVLRFPPGQEELNPVFGALLRDLGGGEAKGYQLHIANALWAQKGYPFLKSFLDIGKTHYAAALEELDFVQAAEEARQTINAWVEKQTEEKITNLIPSGVLDDLTRMVLTNAIYFKGAWTKEFDKSDTQEQEFWTTPDRSVQAPLMQKTDDFNYGETDDCQVLELPYAGGDLSMVVLLPRDRGGLEALERGLSASAFAQYLSNLRTMKVEVSLPKFKVTSKFSLKDALTAMGMPLAFTYDADFSGMTGNKELYISAVLHKAFVDVNEEGTEAAAATAVVMTLKSAPALREKPKVFRADHPFVLIIRDKRSASVLFLGRVANPV